MLLKNGENVVWVSNILDPDVTPSFSASHPDPRCLHMALGRGLRAKCLSYYIVLTLVRCRGCVDLRLILVYKSDRLGFENHFRKSYDDN